MIKVLIICQLGAGIINHYLEKCYFCITIDKDYVNIDAETI